MTEDTSVNTEFDIELPDDIPLPTEAVDKTIKDTFDGAFNFCFVGSGQGGGRLAQTFYETGYQRVCAVNTSDQDMRSLTLPKVNQYIMGGGGAGKQPEVADHVFRQHREDVLDLMRRSFGPEFDRIFVCVGAGGGTGAGTAVPLVYTAKELQAVTRMDDNPVGVIVALPQNSEGRRVCANAHSVLRDMLQLVNDGVVSPLIILDNDRIRTIYPGLAVDPFWNTANRSIVSIFHLFNVTSSKPSSYTSFDPTDFKTILDSGTIVFGATPVKDWSDSTAISYAIRDNLKKNMLAGGIDLATGKIAGAIVIGGKEVLAQVPHETLDHGFDQLTRILAPRNVVHRGIYSGNKPTLAVYTIIGGLGKPIERIAELSQLGGSDVKRKSATDFNYWNRS